MPHYLFRARYTSDSLKAMIENPQDREQAARSLVESAGGTLVCFYFSMGEDDVFAVTEAPDDTTAAAVSIAIGASGAFAGGGTTKLLTATEALASMKMARAVLAGYSAPAQ